MPIIQDDLNIMMAYADSDLNTLTVQLSQTNANIAEQTSDQVLYQGMLTKAEADLNDRLLNVKLPLVIAGSLGFPLGPYPLAYIDPYPVAAPQLSNWAIYDQPGPIPPPVAVYAYTNNIVSFWTPGGAETDPAIGVPAGLGTYATTRVLVTPTANGSVFQLSVKTGAYSIILRSVYIGQRDGVSQDVLAGTNTQITFSGGDTEIQINPGETILSDWITFNLVAVTEYFVSIYFEGRIHQFSLGSQFWQNGDFAATEAWAAAGTSNANTWFTAEVEGWDSTTGPGWDSDVLLTRNINDWDAIRPLIYGKPFGTQAMITALNSAKRLITTRRNQIVARNPVLIHFSTVLVYATVLPGGGRTITPSGSVYVDYGKDQTFTFGGTVNYVDVDGVNLGVIPSYTFTNVTEEHTIRVF